jgi:hypothetical protein
MIETLKHLFGFCGEGHTNLFLIIPTISATLYYYFHTIKYCVNAGCKMCKEKLLKLKK